MKRIDRETVQKILDTADIVEVVSDFVNLKKRGANWIGLCPFHNERTPSFSVSRSKGICKCFSCGKGGSSVNFIMEHEQMTFNEALRYLAKKYNIEIKEHELTDKEREEATERETLLAVNEFALEHFRNNLDTPDGKAIGLAYFLERGINKPMIEKFRLGYAIDRSDELYKAATSKGFDEKYLFETGLCARSERGGVYDRFRGRVIYPVFTVSGRVIAFGGRTLRRDKNVAKYVNSPESQIYHKSYELYGLYQAKGEIVKRNKCILVEGYMDVISMHQVGVSNVVASSGTSLTEGQIRLIHRFTENVTVIYDSDPAGIKASLRGIDLLLAEGLNIKVLLLPDGEDPDSFAQKHSGTEVEAYIAENETDFIRFKTSILLKDVNGPVERTRVINDIVRSISVIPDALLRSEYIKECSRMLDANERVLTLQLQKMLATAAEKRVNTHDNEKPDQTAGTEPEIVDAGAAVETVHHTSNRQWLAKIEAHEKQLARYIVKYGLVSFEMDTEGEDKEHITVLDFIRYTLEDDGIVFTNPVYRQVLEEAVRIAAEDFADDNERACSRLGKEREEAIAQGRDHIRAEAKDLAEIEAMEKLLLERCDEEYAAAYNDFLTGYLQTHFLSAPEDALRTVTTELAFDKYTLSKVHTKFVHVESEVERLGELVPRAVLELKLAILDSRIAEKNASLNGDVSAVNDKMKELFELYRIRSEFARLLGERTVNPR